MTEENPVNEKLTIVSLGAQTASELAIKAKDLAGRTEDQGFSLAGISSETNIYKSENRLALVVSSPEMLKEGLGRAAKFLETGKGKRLLPGRGIFVHVHVQANDPLPASEQKRGTEKLAMLFPGQGAQSVGMFRELATSFDVVQRTLDEADHVLADELPDGRKLTDFIFGRDVEPEIATEALKQTTITQPALLACDVAMLRLLAELGIRPDMVAGHSLGEYAACVAAEVMSFPDALKAVTARGRAMTSATPQGTDPGWMAAVSAPLSDVEPLLQKIDGYAIPANKNCHAQTIIAGASDAIERAMALFDEEGFQTIRLPVSHAFHTKIVAPASAELSRVLEQLEVGPPKIPVLANATGSEYPEGDNAPQEIVGLLSRQVASPVEFIAEVERMYELGATSFLEVGPKRTLTSFVDNILGKRPHQAFSSNNPRKGDMRSLIETLAWAEAIGLAPNHDAWT